MANDLIIKVGDKFKTPTSIYTVTAVNDNRVTWDCVGRKYWMKNVNKQIIAEWITDERLQRVD